MHKPVTIVILAAGLGTRMKSRQAKVLHKAGGKTLLQHVIDTALELAPPERIFAVVGHQAEQVRQSVAGSGIGFIQQTEQKGTGHAVLMGRDSMAHLDGYLMVLYGDCPLLRASTLRRLIEQETEGSAAGVLMSALMDDPTGYGRVIHDAHGDVLDVVEQKSGTPEQLAIREANMGIYCFRADLFWKHVAEIQPNNAAGEYYLTDMPAILRRAGHRVEAMCIDDAGEALGINDRAQLAMVDAIFRERKRTAVMAARCHVDQAGNHHDRFRRRDRHGYDHRAVRADSRQDDNRRELPHRRLLHRAGFRAGGRGGNRRLHRGQYFHAGARCQCGALRAFADGQSGGGRRPHRELCGVEEDAHARRR